MLYMPELAFHGPFFEDSFLQLDWNKVVKPSSISHQPQKIKSNIRRKRYNYYVSHESKTSSAQRKSIKEDPTSLECGKLIVLELS
jgi:hypothetical protein